jgi:TetR/AcrR family transcriptional regulator, transcriptional repressor of bet genes
VKKQKKAPKKAPAASEDMLRQPLPLRQRQRLIDACITALHLYGPTGATVARVVAIAKLSPGIVRFYFQSKAAMLVASLQFLATEFEERVVTPVVALRDQPALALQRLVELYLDADIASPRKVAVWYAFWGEASARQEYLAICGQKDANFAAVVHDLIDRMIALSGRRHLDSEAVALGLLGVLEMQWQGFAFEEEVNIDRALARRRCMAYLRSVFPREFSALEAGRTAARGMPGDFDDERERVFRGAWQFAGLEQDVPRSGDCAAFDLAETRVLVVRDAAGKVRAFRNTCLAVPHALVTMRRGPLSAGRIACTVHGLNYGLDGRAVPPRAGADLPEFEVHRSRGLIFVRSPAATRRWPEPDLAGLEDASDYLPVLDTADGSMPVEADWKIVMRQLLESRAAGAATGQHRLFLWPNLWIEQSADALSILQVVPTGAGRSRVQRFDYAAHSADAAGRARDERTASLARTRLEADLAIAVSTQQGETDPDYRADASVTPSPAVSSFLRLLLDAEN